jgi:hypothetical protein
MGVFSYIFGKTQKRKSRRNNKKCMKTINNKRRYRNKSRSRSKNRRMRGG